MGRKIEVDPKRVIELYTKGIPPRIIADRLNTTIRTVKKILGLTKTDEVYRREYFWK